MTRAVFELQGSMLGWKSLGQQDGEKEHEFLGDLRAD